MKIFLALIHLFQHDIHIYARTLALWGMCFSIYMKIQGMVPSGLQKLPFHQHLNTMNRIQIKRITCNLQVYIEIKAEDTPQSKGKAIMSEEVEMFKIRMNSKNHGHRYAEYNSKVVNTNNSNIPI